jgi:uncharacterized membrane protein
MIEAHTVDAWTRPAARQTTPFGYLLIVGGFAAPLFLWLAGLGLVMSAERVLARTGRRAAAADAVVRRGAEIFILAFLFRLQAFTLSPGSAPVTLFRVDILNVMGPAMAAAGLLWSVSRGPRRSALVCAAAAILVAMATPVVRGAAWVDALPIWIQWYLRPFGDHTTFTLLPWAGFVFAGAACGSVLVLPSSPRDERRALLGFAISGAALFALGFYSASRPSIYAVSNFWTSSPTYFAVRAGALMLVLGGCFALSTIAARLPLALGVLERFGRNSLFIYWIHVELVYGYATWIIHRRLPISGTVAAYLLFCAAMYGAITLRDRILTWWRSGRSRKTASRAPATARA